MLLLLSLLLGKRWLTYSIILGALLGAGFLVVFNLPNGPLQGLRESQIVGRFGTLLDNQSNTAKVRQYIWEGVVRMLSPHEPLVYPDGTTDTWNFMRLLIGYGPEGMYVAYNPFYSSDLGHVERRNASPDRSHNETWDSLVMTGVFGLVAYLFLFLGLFYYVFSSLNLLKSDLNKRLYWGIAGLSGLVGSLVILIWGGIAYLGVGLPFSLAIGLLIYLMFFALSQKYQRPATDSEMARALLMIALASAVMAHWLEINFGIAIVATRTHFWIYTGLILLLGHVFPRLGDYSKMTATPSLDLASDLAPGLSDRPARTKRKVKESSRKIKVGGPTHWLMNSITVAIPLGMMLVALAYNFITNSNHLQSSTDIIWLSLTRLSAQNSDVSYWLLTMVLVSWLIGGLVWMNEITEVGTWRVWAKSFGLILSFSIAILLLYAYWHASGLSEIASSTVTNLDQLLVQVNRLGLLLSRMYIYLFILIIAYGMSIVWVHQRQEHSVNVYAALAGCVGLVLVVFSIQSTNIQVIQADIAFKMAEPFTNQGQWPVATRLYQYSLGLAPSEDHYYLFLGRSYLEQAKEQTEIEQQTLLINNAESDLKRAQRINPLNTDHTANLARLYTWWASSSSDLSQKLERAEKASNYYRLATTLSPNNATLWGEWATLYLEIVGDFAQAKTILDHALSVDSRYNFVYGLLGDYELSISRQLTDQEDRIERISSALEYYERAVEVSVGRDASSKAEYMIMLGNTHIELAVADPTSIERQHILEAIQIFIDILSLNSPSIRVWQLNEQIAQLYLQIDDRNSAEPYLQEALANAPDDQKTRIGDLYAQLYGQP
jgi:tetratricopeptide (TPR) repeat protein